MVPKPKRNNAQHQPLTTVLRNIIREYPPGGGVLRELCQNADDSGATTIEFVLDQNQHPTDNLLHDRLAEYQGPSLLAYNDRPFSETDFLSLSRIGDSEKAHDESSTGKFGRGFNSVYNWTDGPTILSGNSLLLLDPHHYWSLDVHQPGGPLYDFVADYADSAMANQLSPFKRHVLNFSQSFDGTVIRLPLRTAEQASKSEIIQRRDRKPTTADDIKEAFMSYATEMSESLLFLKHISSITLKIGDTVFAKAVGRKFHGAKDLTNTFSIEEPYSEVLIRGDKPHKDEQFMMEISFQKQGALHISRYAITHHMRHKVENPDLQRWARSYKLFPWTAVAFPLSYSHEFRGRLFSTLPLPQKIQHPAHIHAMFSITPDRQSIHSASDSTISESAEAKKGALWNKWIFQELVVHAWVANLQFINDLAVKTDSGMSKWLHWPAGKQEHGETGIPGTEILGVVFKNIVAQKRGLLPTICDTMARGSDAIFASELEESLRNALRKTHIEVICPPNDRLYELARIPPQNVGVRHISPAVIRSELTVLSKDLGLGSLDVASRSVLLDYILSDNTFQSIGKCQAPLLPIMDGTYRSFTCSGVRYRFSQKDEIQIFEDCKAYLIDRSKLSDQALHIFATGIKDLEKYTSISPWSLSGASWYCKEYVFKDEISRKVSDDTIYRPDLSVEWMDRFWSWAILKHRQQVVTGLTGLWLLPLAGQRYYKIGSASKALGVFGSSRAAEVLRGILETSPEASRRYPVFTGHEMSLSTANSFQGMGIIMNCGSFEELVKWLALFPGFLSALGNEERTGIVNCLGNLAGQGLPLSVKKRVAPLLRKLPLFRDAFGAHAGSECTWISLDNPRIHYVVIPDENTLLDLCRPRTTFICVGDPAAVSLLHTFKLADIPLNSDLLEKYVIPAMSDLGDKMKTALSRYVLQPHNALDLSQKSQEILKLLQFVPVHGKVSVLKSPSELVDPKSDTAKLYFEDESIFPDNDYLEEFQDGLERLGMITSITESVILNRLETYSKLPLQIDKISEMLQHLFVAAPKPPVLEPRYVELKWVPASMITSGVMTLCSPCDCRNSSQKARVKYSMPLTELEVGPWWSKQLGWDRTPAVHHILKQLDEAINHQDNEVITALLDSGWLYIDAIANQLENKAWIPGVSGGYHRHSEIFLRNARFHPYIDNISPQVVKYFRRTHTLAPGKLKQSPSANKLREIQNIIARKGKLSDNDLTVFLSLLEALPAYGTKIDPKQWKAPDIEGVLYDLADLTAGDALHDGQEKAVTNLKFLHPNVSLSTIKALRIPTIQERFLDQRAGAEFGLDFAQHEDPVTAISDTLQRYPFESTFNEYLANAEDSGSAQKIRWVVDRTENYPNDDKNLITPALRECAGAGLVCYNNGVFSEKDFEAVVKIGVNRRDNPLKIGRFGRGSLTMLSSRHLAAIITNSLQVSLDLYALLCVRQIFRYL
ncbi:hypothetical protein BDD12DRAFT_943100 [Trichophaea hybrida]|nr:hypothetical protein BDD12DRAFT_943100 [Trichophaea hybrida]